MSLFGMELIVLNVLILLTALFQEAKLQCVEMTKATLDNASLKCCNFDKRLGNVTQMVGECETVPFRASTSLLSLMVVRTALSLCTPRHTVYS